MAETEQFNASQDSVQVQSLDLPPQCRVVLFNDDFTTKEFVVELLMTVFHKSNQEAVTIMESVHQNGTGVAGVYTYDIAVTRANIAVAKARKRGFPLKVEVEKV